MINVHGFWRIQSRLSFWLGASECLMLPDPLHLAEFGKLSEYFVTAAEDRK